MMESIIVTLSPENALNMASAWEATALAFDGKPTAVRGAPAHHACALLLGMALRGEFTPVLAKHTKNFGLQDSLSIGVDRMQRSFEPMRRQVDAWRERQLSDDAAKLIIYRAFIGGDLEVPKRLARVVHSRYFDAQHEEFAPRTLWSLSNAFTSAFKELRDQETERLPVLTSANTRADVRLRRYSPDCPVFEATMLPSIRVPLTMRKAPTHPTNLWTLPVAPSKFPR